MKPAFPLFAASAMLAAHGLAMADSGRSLSQVRSEMNSGTWAGITLYKSPPKAEPAAAASAPAGKASSAGERVGSFLGWGEPLSQQPLSTAKRQDSPSYGTPIPTAATAAGAASDASARVPAGR
jgi:hypothetical protein